MNVDLTPTEIRWLAGMVEHRLGDLRLALNEHVDSKTALASGLAAEMRRAVAVTDKLEAALRPRGVAKP